MRKPMRNLRLMLLYCRVNMASALAYRSAFLMQAGSMAISNATFVFFWWIAFGIFRDRIGGYTFEDVMFVWSLTSSACGLSFVLFGNAGHISRTIISGELDLYLLQPKPIWIGLLCSRSTLSGWGDFVYGFILLALTQGNSPQTWLVFVPAVIIGGCLVAAVAMMAHTLTFFFGDASFAGTMAFEFILNFSLYPIGIFPAFIRGLMYTLIPAAILVHVPLELVHGFSLKTLALFLLAVPLYCFIAYRFFLYGLKRYESGNLIATRM